MTQPLTNLAAMLRRHRVNESLGLREMARRIGFSAATLSRIERGYPMQADTLMALLNWMLRTNGNGKRER